MHAVILWLYTGDYSDNIDVSGASPIFNIKVFALAEKYAIQTLSEDAARQFMDALHDEKWDQNEFLDAAEEWAKSTADPDHVLGKALVTLIGDHKELFYGRDNAHLRFRNLLNHNGWLAAEMARQLAQRLSQQEEMQLYRCRGKECGQLFRASMQYGDSMKTCPMCNTLKMTRAEWKKHIVAVPEHFLY